MKFKSSELLVNRLELLGNRVHKSEFVNEIRTKINEFIKEIQAMNSELLKSVYFSKLLGFCDNQNKGDTTCCHH